jgi:hypothetical protein
MNPFNFGSAAQAKLESDSALTLKRKKQSTLVCNRSCIQCQQTQCKHAHPHPWEPDCMRKECQRDQVLRVVDCVVCDGT